MLVASSTVMEYSLGFFLFVWWGFFCFGFFVLFVWLVFFTKKSEQPQVCQYKDVNS